MTVCALASVDMNSGTSHKKLASIHMYVDMYAHKRFKDMGKYTSEKFLKCTWARYWYENKRQKIAVLNNPACKIAPSSSSSLGLLEQPK